MGAALFAFVLTPTPARAEEAASAQAARLIQELSAATADSALVGPWLERARHALERAANARRAGDHRHGSELEALALELAQGAVDLRREKQAQARASEAEEKALAAETRVIRVRALVEQTAARRGRAAERLRELEADQKNPAASPPSGETKKAAPGAATSETKKAASSTAPEAQKAAPSSVTQPKKAPTGPSKSAKPEPGAP